MQKLLFKTAIIASYIMQRIDISVGRSGLIPFWHDQMVRYWTSKLLQEDPFRWS